MRKIICFVFLLFTGFEAVRADDVKVKLNSADGSTSFQVRDSEDVVVSSITSLGAASFNSVIVTGTADGSVNIQSGALSNKTVKNEDLIITSTFTQVSSITEIAENTAWADLPPFYATLNVTEQPAIIYAVFSSTFSRTDENWDCAQTRILIDGNHAGSGGVGTDGGDTQSGYAISTAAAWRVTATGDKVVKVQQWHWGTMTMENCIFSAFWIPCSP